MTGDRPHKTGTPLGTTVTTPDEVSWDTRSEVDGRDTLVATAISTDVVEGRSVPLEVGAPW